MTGIGFVPLALGCAALLVASLWGLEHWRSWREELGAEADGLLPPAATVPPAHAIAAE